MLIAEELEPYRLCCRTGRLPDELEDILGQERYQAWLAIDAVRRKVFQDRMDEFLAQVLANKGDIGYAVVYALRQLVDLALP